MLKTTKGKSILRFRWGDKRSKGHILRVDPIVRHIVDSLVESDRRRWVSAVIHDAYKHRLFKPQIKE